MFPPQKTKFQTKQRDDTPRKRLETEYENRT